MKDFRKGGRALPRGLASAGHPLQYDVFRVLGPALRRRDPAAAR